MARRTDGTRPAALAALVVIAAVALRGYVPGAEEPAPERSSGNPTSTAFVIGLLIASVAIVGVAVVARLRSRVAAPPGTADRADWRRGERSKPTWRMMVLAFGVVLAWLLAVMLLNRLGAMVALDAPEAPPPEPTSAAPDPGSAAPGQTIVPAQESTLLEYFYGATVAFLLILVVGTAVAARRRRRPPTQAPSPDEPRAGAPDAGSESLVRAAEVGLAEVEDLSREPRKAIIACYAAMEGELSRVPGAMPQDFDTASEVLARAVAQHALGPDSATQLVDLFDEARFSPHVMTEAHRDAAVRVLQRVLDELRSDAAAVGSWSGP